MKIVPDHHEANPNLRTTEKQRVSEYVGQHQSSGLVDKQLTNKRPR